MEFKNEDLLTYSEIKTLATCDLPNKRAEILASKLKKYCFIRQEGDKNIYYRIQDNIVYKAFKKDIDDKVKLIQSQFIEKSYENLPKEEKKKLKKLCDNKVKIYKNSTFSEYDSQLIDKLSISYTDKRMKSIDRTPFETHYRNGYYDAKKEKFRQREFGKHFVTKIINRDYVPSTEKQREAVLQQVRKIYFNKDDLEAILMIFGSTLSGDVAVDQTSLMLIGDGSAGKSVIMELTLATLEVYVIELASDTFVMNNPKKDKILNSLLINPQCRYLWLNEFKDAKLDESAVKDIVDGKVKTTSLYEDGLNVFTIDAKVFGTMNTLPNFIVDGGMTRRLDCFEHKSKFTPNDSEVDEKNHVYKRDKKFIANIIKMDLLNAWFDILMKYCVQWMSGKELKYTANFSESKQLLTGSNDKLQDFIDSKLTVTGIESDIIGKDTMRTEFLKSYTDKHTTVPQIIMLMKQKKILYNANIRSGGIRGVFIGVKWKSDYDDEEQEEALNNGVDRTDQSVDQAKLLQKEYDELKAKYEALLKSTKPVKTEAPKEHPFDTLSKYDYSDEDDEKPKKKVKTSNAKDLQVSEVLSGMGLFKK